MIWTEGLDHLKIFDDYLNNIHPTVKLTSNHSLTNVPFLDIMVSLHNGTIETDLLNLQTNTNTYLVHHCHPRHTKKAIPLSLGAANILALKLYIYLTVTIPLTAYLLLFHLTHHFLTFLTSRYVNIFIIN